MYINHSKKNKKGGAWGGLLILRLVAILALVLMPLLPTHSVSAQCENPPCPTETPLPPPPPTATPRFGDPIDDPFATTPTPSVLGDCPTTEREYGRDLSINWVRACGECYKEPSQHIATFEPFPTIDYGGALGTVYPTAIPAGTPTPTGEIAGGWQRVFIEGFSVPYNTTTNKPGIDNWVKFLTTTGHHPQTFNGRIDWHIDSFVPSGTYGGTISFQMDHTAYLNHLGVKFKVVNTNIPNLPNASEIYITPTSSHPAIFLIPQGTKTAMYNVDYFLEYEVTTFGENGAMVGQEQLRIRLLTEGTYHTDTGSIDVIWRSGDYPVPNTGYCSTWGYADDEFGSGTGSASTPIFALPNINIRQGQCIDFIPPFDWFRDADGSFLFDIDLSFPGIGICPVWVDIDPLEIVGQEIPFEILILPAVMFVFGLLFKL